MVEKCSNCVFLKFVQEEGSSSGKDMRRSGKCVWGQDRQSDTCRYHATPESLEQGREIYNETNGHNDISEKDYVTPKRMQGFESSSYER